MLFQVYLYGTINTNAIQDTLFDNKTLNLLKYLTSFLDVKEKLQPSVFLLLFYHLGESVKTFSFQTFLYSDFQSCSPTLSCQALRAVLGPQKDFLFAFSRLSFGVGEF